MLFYYIPLFLYIYIYTEAIKKDGWTKEKKEKCVQSTHCTHINYTCLFSTIYNVYRVPIDYIEQINDPVYTGAEKRVHTIEKLGVRIIFTKINTALYPC